MRVNIENTVTEIKICAIFVPKKNRIYKIRKLFWQKIFVLVRNKRESLTENPSLSLTKTINIVTPKVKKKKKKEKET